MSNFENSGPAFPSNRDMRYEQEFDREGGMTLRQYAAVKMEAAYRVMVDRFLSWKLPQDFGPDAGISFTPPPRLPDLYWPTGTNLFHAGQALEMFKHCVELPSAVAVRLAEKNLFDAQEAAKTITKQAIAAEAERDALAAELKALREQEPVAFMHDQETRRDCVHIEVLDFLQRANSHYGCVNKIQRIPLDTTEHYTIPLYARPVPAEPVNARLLDVAVWPAGYCRDPNGKMSIPAGKEEDFNFGYDVGFQEAWEILNSAISAAGKSPTSQQERLLQDMHDAGREVDRVMAEAAPKAVRLTEAEVAAALNLFPQPSSLVLKITRAIETAVLRKNGIKVAE